MVSFFVIGATFALFVFYELRTFRQDFLESVLFNTRGIGESCVGPLVSRNRARGREILRGLEKVQNVAYGVVFDTQGRLFASYSRTGDPFIFDFPEQESLTEFRKEFLHIVFPLSRDNEKYGKMYLLVSTDELNSRTRRLFILASMVAGALLVLSFFLGRLFQYVILRPILSLSGKLRNISASQDYALRLKRKGHREVGLLERRFNDFLEQIQIFDKEREKAELACQKIKEKYSELFENISVGLMAYRAIDNGEDFECVDINKAGEVAEHKHRMDLIGQSINKILAAEESPNFLRLLQRVWKSGTQEYYTLSRRKKDRVTLWREYFVFKISSDELIAVFNDTTESKRAEEILQNKYADLKQRFQERTDELDRVTSGAITHLDAQNSELKACFFAISHFLHKPLEEISEFNQSLLMDYASQLDDKGKNNLVQLRAASQKMKKLFKDLMILSEISSSRLRRKKLDLGEIAWKIAVDLKENNPERIVNFNIQDGMIVEGDEKLLSLALDHLLHNAWRFTKEQPKAKITVGTRQENNRMEYFVKDNGMGFDMGQADKLFIPFFRLHEDDLYPGNGLGLAIARRIIHRHNGLIWGEGKADQGATFYFTL